MAKEKELIDDKLYVATHTLYGHQIKYLKQEAEKVSEERQNKVGNSEILRFIINVHTGKIKPEDFGGKEE